MKSLISLFLFTSLIANGQSKDSINYGNNKQAGHIAEIRGMKMYYETYGSGYPLLIIHGNSGSIGDFSNQIPYFSSKYKVILADSRDHGNTLDTLHMSDSLSYEMMSDDYAALLQYLKIDSAYVLGWSDGGINGILLAIRHPEKVKKLVALGANLWSDTTAINPFILSVFKMQYLMMQKRKTGIENTLILRHYKLILTEPNIKAQALSGVKCPTLVIGGDHDAIQVPHTVLIAQYIPNSNLWIVPNAGHGLLIQYKDKFNAEVADFFKRPFKKVQGFDLFKN